MDIIEEYYLTSDSYIFYDALVCPGTPGLNQTENPVRVTGYRIGNAKYYAAADRLDLTAEQTALIYKLQRDIEKFFQRRKKHLRVYHLIARSEYGVMVQLPAGLITYLLTAIYCRKHCNEPVSAVRLRQIRTAIQNELRIPSDILFLILLLPKNREKMYAKN